MTRADFLAWLRGRGPQAPAALAAELERCVARAPDEAFAGGSPAEVAGDVGLATLREVVRRQEVAQDGALRLLAADAFVTYAFEAAAEADEDGTALAQRLLGEVG
jgi:hypothetical protein